MSQSPVIAIIDDDASVRGAVSRLVRSLGHIACTFASADEFLHSSRSREPSCLIADVQMPGMSGVELQDHLLAQGRRVPIIFMTAFPDDNIRRRALDAGAVCFLTKPFDGSTLIRHLDAALAQHRDQG